MSFEPQQTPDRAPPRLQEVLSSRLVVGILIIFLGGLLLLDNLDVINARHVLRMIWPLVLVCVGVVMVRGPDHRRSRAWGWVLITVGTWIFLDRLGWVDMSLWDMLIPGLLLFVGGSLVYRAIKGPSVEVKPGEDPAEFVRSFAFMGGCEVRPVSRPFRGADLSAVMGGVKLDLFDARMEGDTAVIDVFAFWGGVEIFVPPDWTVTSKVTNLLGGFIDKRRPTSVVPTKTLIISGTVVMSGIEVKN